MATCCEAASRILSSWRSGLFRVKSPRAVNSEEEERCSTVVDVVSTGLGGALAIGVYVVAGVTSQNVAGPSVVISIIVALLAASLSAICFVEFRCRWPQVIGSAYEYNYLSAGEGTAFLIGWLVILERVSCIAALARSVSQYFDFLLGNKLLQETKEHIGQIDLFKSYPDFLSCFIAIAFTALIAVGVKRSKTSTLINNCFTVLATLFCLVVGIFHLDFNLWKDVEEFFPFGYQGVMEGAATFFYAFTTFADMTSKLDMTRRENKATLLGSLLAVFGVLVCFFLSVTSTITLLSPISHLKTETPYAESFANVGNQWLQFVLCPTAIIVLIASIIMVYADLTNLICNMAEDGLLFHRLSVRHERTGTTLIAIFIVGIVSGVFSLLLHTTNLIQLASLCALTVFTISATSVTILRYCPIGFPKSPQHRKTHKRRRRRRENTKSGKHQPKAQLANGSASVYGATSFNNNTENIDAEAELSPSGHRSVTFSFNRFDPWENQDSEFASADNSEGDSLSSSSDTDIDEVVEEYKEKLRVATITTCGIPSNIDNIPSEATYKRASWAITGVFLSNIFLSAILTHEVDRVRQGSVIAIFFLVVFLLIVLVSTLGLLIQPRDKVTPFDLPVAIPLVPWTPVITLLINIHLMLRLPALVWVQAILWISTGVVLYLCYGISHSRTAMFYEHLPEEERVLLPRSPSPVLQSHIVEAHQMPSGYQDVDTVLIE